MRKSFLFLSLVILFSSCGPREDESLSQKNGGGDVIIEKGKVISELSEGAKLSTCSEPNDPTWNSIRLFPELQFMFSKVNDLNVIVAKGSFNCVKVSSKDTVEIEAKYSDADKSWQGLDAHYLVTRLELMNTADFIASGDKFKEAASGMGMSEEQLKTYLSSPPVKDQVNITYLAKPGEQKIPKDGGSSGDIDDLLNSWFLPGSYLAVRGLGQKLPTCAGSDAPTWSTVRWPLGVNFTSEQSSQVKTLVSFGEKNCLPVRNDQTVELEVSALADKPDFAKVDAHYFVRGLDLMYAEDLLTSAPNRLASLMESLGLNEEQLRELLKQNQSKYITLTFLEYSENKVEADAPVGTVAYFGLPQAEGLTASDCKNTWTTARVFKESLTSIKQALQEKRSTVLINQGEFNCLPIGTTASMTFQNGDGSFTEDKGFQFKVLSVTQRSKSDYLRDPVLTALVADEMSVTSDVLLEELDGFSKPMVNITRIEWLGGSDEN